MAINRRKTDEVRICPTTGLNLVVWAIELDGEAIGQAVANYKSRTQRTWEASITVDGVTVAVDGIASISKAVTALNEKLVAATAVDAASPADANLEIVATDEATA